MQSKKNTGKDPVGNDGVNRRRTAAVLAALLLVALAAMPFAARQIGRALYPCRYSQTVTSWAEEYDVDPLAVYSIIRTESGFDPKAESNVGARGLMQITEETFAWIKLQIAPAEQIGFDDLYDPEVNIRFGAYYLARCTARYGDLATAAAAYHSGWGTVDTLLKNEAYAKDATTLAEFPYEQMNLYVYKVRRTFDRYRQLYGA